MKKGNQKSKENSETKSKRVRGTRQMPDRQEIIHAILNRRVKIEDVRERLISAEQLAEELQEEMGTKVVAKTVARDIRQMIDRRRLPIESTTGRGGGYWYTEVVTEFPGIHLTKSELFVLLLAVQALAAYRNTNFETPIRFVINKLLKLIPDEIQIDIDQLESMISFRPGPHEAPVDLDVFDAVCSALINQKELTFMHVTPEHPDKPMLRRVRALHLCVYAYAWYLFTHDLTYQKESERLFALSRMQGAKETEQSFTVDSVFDIEAELEHCFGIDRRGEPVDIRLRFSRNVQQFIKERRWHKSQQLVPLENGGIDLIIHVRPTEEVVTWISGWRKDCVVMEPVTLAQKVRDELRQQVGMYDGLPETPVKTAASSEAS